MYLKVTRLFTLFTVLICLPFQGLAAVAMPTCAAHDQKAEVHADAGVMVDMTHCDHHHDGKSQSQTKKAPCDKCFSCYLSATQAIVPFAIAVNALGATTIVAGPIKEFRNQVLPPLFHPPRLTFA